MVQRVIRDASLGRNALSRDEEFVMRLAAIHSARPYYCDAGRPLAADAGGMQVFGLNWT